MIERFYGFCIRRRRGDGLPARLRIVAHRGVTLVELMISMLILTIVCISWLEIIGIQSAKKEARRREAVERLAGMMDAFMYAGTYNLDYYMMNKEGDTVAFKRCRGMQDPSVVQRMFDEGESSIGYQLRVVQMNSDVKGGELINTDLFGASWKSSSYWLVGRLFDKCGAESETGAPFFSMSVYLFAL